LPLPWPGRRSRSPRRAVRVDDLATTLAALAALADHGEIGGDSITGGYLAAEATLAALAAVGVDVHAVTGRLDQQGLTKFEDSWAELMSVVHPSLHR